MEQQLIKRPRIKKQSIAGTIPAMMDAPISAASQFIKNDVVFDEICDDYFRQPKENQALANFSESLEDIAATKPIGWYKKSHIHMNVSQSGKQYGDTYQRVAVPLRELPNFMRYEISPKY